MTSSSHEARKPKPQEKPTMKRPTLLRSIIATVLLFLAPQLAIATTRTVTNLNDSGTGSLRQAIADSSSGDTINFSVTGTISLTTGQLLIQNKNLTIDNSAAGPNALDVFVGVGLKFRVFQILGSTVTISGLTIDNGHTGLHGDGYGGGIANSGTLTLNNCVIYGNQTETDSNFRSLGGGIYNDGTLTMSNCTVEANVAYTNCTTVFGGGIYNKGTLTMNSCTVDANSINEPCNLADLGEGLANVGGTASITNCTFDENSVYNGAPLTVRSCTFQESPIPNDGTAGTNVTLNIGNSLLSGVNSKTPKTVINYGGGGTVTSAGYNLSDDDASGLLTASGDQINTDPKLEPNGPQYNGGYTDTIALRCGSPAIDQGKSFGATTDQRGQPRPHDNPNIANASGGDGSDIGAYEAPDDPIQIGITAFVVNTTADHDDGVCGSCDCTLREAVNAAANASGTPRITFAANVTGTITVQSQIGINNNVTIEGPGARTLAVSGGGTTRILNVTSSATGTTISGLTIRDGHYDPAQNHGETRQGGAVFNQAGLTFTDCAFINNAIAGASNITNGGNGGTGQGGAIFNAQNLNLYRCTFYDNSAFGAAGTAFVGSGTLGPGGNGGSGQGGAIFNNTSSSLLIQNCTFNTNTATGGAGGAGSGAIFAAGGDGTGGAIFNLAGASGTAGGISVFATTISGNNGVGGLGAGSRFSHGPNGGSNGGIFAASTTQNNRVGSAIIARNSAVNGDAAPDAEGPFSSAGYNLIGIGDQSSGFNSVTNDQVGTTAAAINPQLGSLQNNGGPTDTMAPLTGSPAIDQGHIFFGLSTDQRGYHRPFDDPYVSNASDGSDIGAFELQLVLPTSAVSRKTHGSAGPFDITLPLSGTSGIECRSGGATNDFTVVATFPGNLTVTGNPQAEVTSGTGTVGSGGVDNGGMVTVSGNTVTIPLTNVANAQRIVVTLFSVSDGTNTNNVVIPMSVLIGDTTGNGAVNSSDIAQTQSQSGQTVTSSNFREDVTVNGSINSSDVALVQSKSGTALPVGVSQSPDGTTTAPKHRGSPEKSF
jgi:CSLREA domain-containing protein